MSLLRFPTRNTRFVGRGGPSDAADFIASIPSDVRERISRRRNRPSIGGRSDWQIVRDLARDTVRRIEEDLRTDAEREAIRARLRTFLKTGAPSMVYQPIYDARNGRMLKVEALARFRTEPYRTPDLWFADADNAGLGLELELQAISNALATFALAWRTHRIPVAVNASVRTIASGALDRLLVGVDSNLVILEIAEQQEVSCYRTLAECLAPLRARGIKVAIDDVGTGYAGMQHVLCIKPDIVKLDISLVRGINADPCRQAMVRSVIQFSKLTGSTTVAEGIETPDELAVLRDAGVDAVQGYLLARPISVEDVLRCLSETPNTPSSPAS